MKKAVVLLSGGMDSAVAAAMMKKEGYDLYCIHFNYGQNPMKKEKFCAKEMSKWLGAKEYKEVDFGWLKEIGGSALTDGTKLTVDNKRREYVPFRNTIFLSLATAYAETLGADAVVIGSNVGDRICPDNNKNFINSFQKVIEEGTLDGKNIKIRAVLVENNYGKQELVKKGLELKVPFEKTWACHNSIEKACGVCNNCKHRYESFLKNNTKDPIIYEKIPEY